MIIANTYRQQIRKLASQLVLESQEITKQQQAPSSPRPPNLEASVSSISNSSITPSMSASQITTTPQSPSRTKGFPSLGISSSVSSRLQKERIQEIYGMVEREGAVIEAALKRVERLRTEY
jgi:hypothetical protein